MYIVTPKHVKPNTVSNMCFILRCGCNVLQNGHIELTVVDASKHCLCNC